ncbi:MAG: lamin tail domain-containing protein [Cytophagaceae bacterium]|nr:lamin tail domain-containing protein [Cytophagaceae bacterium]
MKKYTLKYLIYFVLIITISSNSLYSQSNIVITEFMYNQPGNDTLEYIELYNRGINPVNLNGYTFTDGVNYTFSNYNLAPGGYVVVAKYPNYANSFYGITALQWTSGDLSNSGEKIILKDPSGNIADSLEYEDNFPWDPNADGDGASLVLCNPYDNNAMGYNWVASNEFVAIYNGGLIFGNPGRGNTSCTAPGEIFPPKVKKVTVVNQTTLRVRFNEPVSVSSSQNTSNYTGIPGISSAIRSASMDSVTLTLAIPLTIGFVDTLYISNIADTTNNTMTSTKAEVVVFNNTIASLAITEIMYNNGGNDTLEFIEVYNKGLTTATVGGYKFTDGVDFMFPTMTINPGQYVVIAVSPSLANAFFGISTTLQFSGALINNGEKLTIKNTTGDVIDSLTYSNTWHWRTDPGASLVLCNPLSDNSIGSNWGASGNFVGTYQTYNVYASPGAANADCWLLGTTSADVEDLLSIYPNPSTGRFEINCETINGQKEIIIRNTLGEAVFSYTTEDNKRYIDLSHLSKGIYFVLVNDFKNNRTFTEKIIVE